MDGGAVSFTYVSCGLTREGKRDKDIEILWCTNLNTLEKAD